MVNREIPVIILGEIFAVHSIVKYIFGTFKHPAWTFKRQIRHTDITFGRNKVRNLKKNCENDFIQNNSRSTNIQFT